MWGSEIFANRYNDISNIPHAFLSAECHSYPIIYIQIFIKVTYNGRDSVSNHHAASLLFTQPFIQTQIKENIKAPRHWPMCGEFTGDRWIPRTNDQ